MCESAFMKRMRELGGKPMDPTKEKAYLNEVENRVIPAILEVEERQRALVHNLRVKPFSLPRS